MQKTISALVLSGLLAATAQAGTLSGHVRDATSGRPIPSASVRIVGSEVVATTSETGEFTLEWSGAFPASLVAAHPGYDVLRVVLATAPAAALDLVLTPMISVADRIEVTATRAREGADPASFTNLPQETVQQAYWGQDPAMMLSELAPGFYAYNDSGNGIGYSYFTVRGFGQARTRVTINGAPLNDAESGELFFIDLADFLGTAGDVQLRRGVFGLSGIGGAVDLTTEAPGVKPSFSLHETLGSFGTSRFAANFSSGLVDGTWALTARYSKVRTDGYRDQSWVDSWNYFISLARFGERSSLRLVLFGGPEQTHLAYDGVPRSVLEGGLTGDADRDRRSNPITYPGEIDNFVQPHYQLVHELQLDPQTTLSQTLYAFQGDGYYDQLRLDRTLAEYNLPDVELPDGTVITESDLVRRRNVDEWDFGWVPSLTRTSGDWTFTLAGEARLHDAHHVGEVKWARYYPEDVQPDQRYYDYRVSKRSGALSFGATWKATARLAFNAGLEVASHRYEMLDDKVKGIAFSESYDFLLPRAGVVATLAPGTELYASVARGMREPNFRQLYDPQDYWSERVSLDPEDVWDWEAGVSLRRAAWRLRANVFLMDFANEIVWAGALDDNGVPVYGNGARSRHRGLELDGSWELTGSLGLDGALTWSHNTFVEFSEQWDPETSVVYDGNRLAGYPDLMASLAVRAQLGALRLRLGGRHVGRFYVDNTEDSRRNPEARQEPGYVPRVNDSFTVVDLAAHYPLPERLCRSLGLSRTELELRVNNLLDAHYTAFGYMDYEPLDIPAAPRGVYAGIPRGL